MTMTVTGSRYLPGTHAQKRPDAAQRAQHYVRQWEQKQRQKRRSEKASILSPTICFSRKIGVGALEIAEMLSQKTGQRVADRLIIEKIAEDADLSRATVAFFDEHYPGRMKELGAFLFGEKSFVMSDYMRKLFSTVITLAETEATIFVGRGTHLILPRDRVLAVRCISSREVRIKRVADILDVSESAARKELDEADKEQRRFFKKTFGKKDAPPEEFDLIINIDFLDQPEWAANVVQQAFISKFQTPDEKGMDR
ncbi:MAG: cytidylate kinase-like family protein [Desulfosarcina sp.]|nr:cytidylate kinase-like family protein [Desulfobacterales bacterium]